MAEKAESNKARNKIDLIDPFCKVCKIRFADACELITHYESKDHKKGILKKKYGKRQLAEIAARDKKNSTRETENPSPDMPTNSKEKSNPDSEESENDETSSSDDDETEYKCEVCNKTIISQFNYDLHINGRKHKNKLKAKAVLEELIRDRKVPDPSEEPKEDNVFNELFPYLSPDSNFECTLCNKKCSTPTAYKQHYLSEGHKKKVADGAKSKEINGQSLVEVVTNGSEFSCDLCEKHFSGLVPYKQHMEGASHLNKEKHFKQLDEIRDLAIIKKGDSKITCKECAKEFSGPIPFKSHLKTTVHSKIKQKSAITNDLENNFPELTIHDSGMLRCEVCLAVFTGPESAKDHYNSAKHRNKVAMKAERKKNKQQKNDKKLLAKSSGSSSKESDSEDFEVV